MNRRRSEPISPSTSRSMIDRSNKGVSHKLASLNLVHASNYFKPHSRASMSRYHKINVSTGKKGVEHELSVTSMLTTVSHVWSLKTIYWKVQNKLQFNLVKPKKKYSGNSGNLRCNATLSDATHEEATDYS